MALQPGDIVGTYRIVRRIGAGGTAEVLEVEHTVLHTSHALKVLLPQWVDNADIRARFLQEGKLQAEFRHPGLVRVTDTVAEPGVAGIVMDLLQGESVRERLEREGSIAPKEAVEWVLAVLDALGYAHERGIIHRDLKPENLFLEKTASGERLRVLDFGIAKGPEGQRTTSRGTLGTVAYMSPEQVEDPGTVDVRTDIFALGAVLWELLVGKPAFEGASAFSSMQSVLERDPGPPSRLRSGVPGWLDDVVQVALRKDPAGRFPTAKAFAAALRASGRGFEAPALAGAAPVKGRSGSGAGVFGLWVIGLMGGALVLGIGAIMVVIGVGVYFRPPVIHSAIVSSDLCGMTTIKVDARARSGMVEIAVNGGAPTLLPISGRQTLIHQVQLDPGSSAAVDVDLNGVVLSQYHQVGGTMPGVSIQLPGARRQGAVGRTLVRVSGSCMPPTLTWIARIDGVEQSGTVSGAQQIWLDTTELEEGDHLIEVELRDGPNTVEVQTASLLVGAAPPPGDLDMDGFVARSKGGRDCDDTNPEINPDADEAPAPNGIDDNCDGRVDEGTVAYDDDGDGLSEDQGDCDDGDPAVHPGAVELADCRDQDCDGQVDEGKSLVQREDGYEPNGARSAAFDLKTGQQRSFGQDLEIISSNTEDEAWFEFYSQDGDFDDWGIDVTASAIPADSIYTLEIVDAMGGSRGVKQVSSDGEQLQIRGRWLRDDGGMYTLRIKPERLYAEWCPARFRLVSR